MAAYYHVALPAVITDHVTTIVSVAALVIGVWAKDRTKIAPITPLQVDGPVVQLETGTTLKDAPFQDKQRRT